MDKKHNIRNMSVIAHVDHVRTPAERLARVSDVDCSGVSIALSEPPSTGFGLAVGSQRRNDDASASRTRVGETDSSKASPEFPATARIRLARRPNPSRPRPRAPPTDANRPHTRHPVGSFCSAGVPPLGNGVGRVFFRFRKH